MLKAATMLLPIWLTMTDPAELSAELLSELPLIGELEASISTSERAAVLARLRRLVEKHRASLEEHTRKFDEMFEEAERRLPIEGLFQLAERVEQSRKGAAEQLYPWNNALQRALLASSEEGRQQIQELIESSESWLEVYETARARLLNLASARQAQRDQVLRARPVPGDIDQGALTREIIARFPKILAALAK